MSDGGWVGLRFSKCTGGSVDFVLPAPRHFQRREGCRPVKGHSKKKSDGPWGGWLVPRRPKKYQGWSDFFSRFFYRVFELPSPRNAQKRAKKKSEKKKWGVGWFLES